MESCMKLPSQLYESKCISSNNSNLRILARSFSDDNSFVVEIPKDKCITIYNH